MKTITKQPSSKQQGSEQPALTALPLTALPFTALPLTALQLAHAEYLKQLASANEQVTLIDVQIADLKAQIATLKTERLQFAGATKPKGANKQHINQGVGDFIRALMLEGLNNKEVLAKVHEHYGNTNTTAACVSWYRGKVNKAS